MMASQTTLLEKKFIELQISEQTPQTSRPKIQRVPEYLRNRQNFVKHYSPMLVSIGPIHHGDANLKLGENYKLMWAAKYIRNARQNPVDLHKKIVDKIDELKGHFAVDVLTVTGSREHLECFGSLEEKLSWMLFVDGCSLLYILETANLNNPGAMNIKVDQLVLVMMDVLLLENQLPYLVLKLLWKNDNQVELIYTMEEFLKCHHWTRPERRIDMEVFLVYSNGSESELPTHLLDLQRTIILTHSSSKTKGNEANSNSKAQNIDEAMKMMTMHRNTQDLRAVGIILKSSGTQMPSDIYFTEGQFTAKLTLPEIEVNNTTTAFYLNLIAYEMCPDFENDYEICSFVYFMDSLIDHPEDVKELRSRGILLNFLGSDEEVVDVFNIISTDLVPNIEIYLQVKCKIYERHCNLFKTWIPMCIYIYFRNPGTFTAFVAAFIALVLTFIQTWFSIRPAR